MPHKDPQNREGEDMTQAITQTPASTKGADSDSLHGPLLDLVQQLIITERENYSTVRKDLETDQCHRIAKGFYLPKSSLPEDLPPWELRRRIALIRHYVHNARMSRLLMFSHQSALLIRELPLLNWPLHIHERLTGNSPSFRRPYPALRSSGRILAGAARTIIHADQIFGDPPEVIAGMPVATLRETARDILTFSPPVEAICEVSILIRHAVHYDRRDLHESQKRLKMLLQNWRDAIEGLPNERGKKRALKLLELCDAKCESIAETKFLWFLHTFKARTWTTQEEFSTPAGLYVADFCFPSVGVLVEIEGVAKLGNGATTVKQNLNALLLRDNALTAQGWKVIHLPASLVLSTPVDLLAHIRQVAPEILSPAPPRRWLLAGYH